MKLLTTLTNAFPLWVLVASGLALVEPTLFTWFRGPLIPLGLGLIMLSMGMTLEFDDFRRIGRERGSVLPGVALQYTLMPGLGWTLATLFELPTPFAVGLILVSCCPGGTASNVISFLARADVALSVAMTAVSTIAAVLMTPVLTEILAGSRVDVPAAGLLLDTVKVVLVPIALGALLRWRFPVGKPADSAGCSFGCGHRHHLDRRFGHRLWPRTGPRGRSPSSGRSWCAFMPAASSLAISPDGSSCGESLRPALCRSRSACRILG